MKRIPFANKIKIHIVLVPSRAENGIKKHICSKGVWVFLYYQGNPGQWLFKVYMKIPFSVFGFQFWC
jgi:hypothetical protein